MLGTGPSLHCATARFAQQALSALEGIPDQAKGHLASTAAWVAHPAVVRSEAAALEALCGSGDALRALECVRDVQQGLSGGREAWGRVTLAVLSLVLSTREGVASALLGSVKV
jgi:hypothetical protein